jgi:hypothetical protein
MKCFFSHTETRKSDKNKISLLSLFPGWKSNQKRLLNFYKELAIASLRCGWHRWRIFAACYGSNARFAPSRAASPLISQHSSV